MVTVWFMPAVLERLKDRRAAFKVCENCVAQYCQVECRKSGKLEANPRVRAELCEVVAEALIDHEPTLRGILDITFKELDATTAAIEVRMSPRFNYYLNDANPGLLRLH